MASGNCPLPAAPCAGRHSNDAAAISTDPELITGTESSDVECNAAAADREVITGSDTSKVQYNAAATVSTIKASSTMAIPNEVHDTSSESVVPKVGMTFKSEEDAYEFYNQYARNIGFSIRKSHSKLRPDKTVYQKHIVCSNEGDRGTHSRHDTAKQNASTRSSCNARVQFSVTRDGVWTMKKVVLEHNHYLASPDKRHMLRSQRRLVESDKLVIGHMREAGFKPAQVYNFFKQWYGGPPHVPFLRVDSNNHICRERKKYLEVNDAQTLQEFLKNKQLEDPSFFYAIQLDEEDCRIANFFWADGQAIMDYACFGDALSFDTTFQTNKFEMPFAPLLGTNHHKQTILFGAALLYDETTESFKWLFNTFLTAMSGKRPVTIFTDQCAAMAKAIEIVFPSTKHFLCLWHIYQNAAKHLSPVISSHPRFLADFKKVVYLENSVPYFEQKWQELLISYDLVENSWLQTLFGLREKWAAVYRNDSFHADMTTTQRSEGMNNVIKKQFRKRLCLSEFLVEYGKCAASLRDNELEADFKSRKTKPVTYIKNLPLLKTAAESYTRRLYCDFEEQFKLQFSVTCELISTVGTVKTYKVMPVAFEDEALVVFNYEDVTISCSCRRFESKGLLCKHALRVFNINEVFTLPSKYILHRWTKYAKRGYCVNNQETTKETLQTRAARISRKATSIALKCSISEELLVELEKAIDMLDLEADESLSQRGPDKPQSVHMNSIDPTQDVTNGNISFKVPQAIKGPKVKRAKDPLEKKGAKKTKAGAKKPKSGTKKGSGNKVKADTPVGEGPHQFTGTFDASTGTSTTIPHISNNMYHGQSPLQFSGSFQAGTSSNITVPHFSNNMFHGQGPLQFTPSFKTGTSSSSTIPHFTTNNFHGDSTAMFGSFMQGGYTELLLQTDQASEVLHPSRRLDFDVPNPEGWKK